MIRPSLRGWSRGSGGREAQRPRHRLVSAAPRRPRSRRLRGSSLARRQSPRARAFRLGRHGFCLVSKATRTTCVIARAVCPMREIDARLPRMDCIVTSIFTPTVLTTTDTDWGPVHIAASPGGVVGASMLGTQEGFRADLERRGYVELLPLDAAAAGPSRALVQRARDALVELLDGGDPDVGSIPINIGDRSAWDRLVLDGVRTIPRGTTASYGEVARRIGRPGAARAVGGAVGRNPVGLLVPCHRVIARDGTLGGYGVAAWGGREGALDLKRQLLALEGVRVAADRVSAG